MMSPNDLEVALQECLYAHSTGYDNPPDAGEVLKSLADYHGLKLVVSHHANDVEYACAVWFAEGANAVLRSEWCCNLAIGIATACALNQAFLQGKYGPDIGKKLALGGKL